MGSFWIPQVTLWTAPSGGASGLLTYFSQSRFAFISFKFWVHFSLEIHKQKQKCASASRIEVKIEDSSIESTSVTQLYLTLCDPMNLKQARPPCPSPTPGVHPNPCPLSRWYHPTISSSVVPFSPPALNLSQHQGLFKWVSSPHQVAKVLEFQLQHQSLQWTPRTDLL